MTRLAKISCAKLSFAAYFKLGTFPRASSTNYTHKKKYILIFSSIKLTRARSYCKIK